MPDKKGEEKNRKPQHTEKDNLLWEIAIRDVTPLAPQNAASATYDDRDTEAEKQPAVPENRQTTSVSRQNLQTTALSTPRSETGRPPGAEDGFSAGLDRRSDERLRRGKMPVEAVLDLHGHRRIEAYDALKDFILDGYNRGRRCVLVVTGKGERQAGTGVIKRSFAGWVKDAALRPYILQYYPAQPRHGGDGAFYILLRKKGKQRPA